MNRFAVFALACLVAACQAQSDDQATQAAPETVPADTSVAPGTPAGDLEQWVADIQAGLDSARSHAAGNRDELQRWVATMYGTRQEFLELYYGTTGRLAPSPALAEAVMAAEARFHDLMQVSMAEPAADVAAIEKAMDALNQQYEVVLTEGRNRTHRLRTSAQADGSTP